MKIKFYTLLIPSALLLTACGDKNTKEADEKPDQKVEVKSVGDLTIGYYDMEKIATDFDFYVKTQKQLEAKRKSLEGKIAAQQKVYESAAIALQKGVNTNTLSQNQIEGYQIKMRGAEEEIYRIQQGEGVALDQESMSANEILINKIEMYAKEFSEKNGLKLFLSKSVGGQVSFIDSTFNMTDPFITYMNEKESEITKDTE